VLFGSKPPRADDRDERRARLHGLLDGLPTLAAELDGHYITEDVRRGDMPLEAIGQSPAHAEVSVRR